MLDEIYVKGGLNFLTTNQQEKLGKQVLSANTFDTFNQLPYNTTTGINDYYSVLGNPFTPQQIFTKGLAQLAKDSALAKQTGYTVEPLAENREATFNMKITPELVEEYFRRVVTPNQSLLYDERGALAQLKATVGIDAQRGFMRVPMADSAADRILQRVRVLQDVNSVLRNRGGPAAAGGDPAADENNLNPQPPPVTQRQNDDQEPDDDRSQGAGLDVNMVDQEASERIDITQTQRSTQANTQPVRQNRGIASRLRSQDRKTRTSLYYGGTRQ